MNDTMAYIDFRLLPHPYKSVPRQAAEMFPSGHDVLRCKSDPSLYRAVWKPWVLHQLPFHHLMDGHAHCSPVQFGPLSEFVGVPDEQFDWEEVADDWNGYPRAGGGIYRVKNRSHSSVITDHRTYMTVCYRTLPHIKIYKELNATTHPRFWGGDVVVEMSMVEGRNSLSHHRTTDFFNTILNANRHEKEKIGLTPPANVGNIIFDGYKKLDNRILFPEITVYAKSSPSVLMWINRQPTDVRGSRVFREHQTGEAWARFNLSQDLDRDWADYIFYSAMFSTPVEWCSPFWG